jgi:hypothetical protein
MVDQADVGDVDAHAERIGADDPGRLGLKVITEPLEQVFLFLRAELPMEKRRVQTHEAEIARQLVADLARRDEDMAFTPIRWTIRSRSAMQAGRRSRASVFR